MTITPESIQHGRALVLRVNADSLETDNVAAFRAAMSPLMDKSAHFVIDLTEVEFMDSTGLGAMLSSEVKQLFEMVMMDRVFDIFETPEDALAK